jgi:hypothetical protein
MSAPAPLPRLDDLVGPRDSLGSQWKPYDSMSTYLLAFSQQRLSSRTSLVLVGDTSLSRICRRCTDQRRRCSCRHLLPSQGWAPSRRQTIIAKRSCQRTSSQLFQSPPTASNILPIHKFAHGTVNENRSRPLEGSLYLSSILYRSCLPPLACLLELRSQ